MNNSRNYWYILSLISIFLFLIFLLNRDINFGNDLQNYIYLGDQFKYSSSQLTMDVGFLFIYQFFKLIFTDSLISLSFMILFSILFIIKENLFNFNPDHQKFVFLFFLLLLTNRLILDHSSNILRSFMACCFIFCAFKNYKIGISFFLLIIISFLIHLKLATLIFFIGFIAYLSPYKLLLKLILPFIVTMLINYFYFDGTLFLNLISNFFSQYSFFTDEKINLRLYEIRETNKIGETLKYTIPFYLVLPIIIFKNHFDIIPRHLHKMIIISILFFVILYPAIPLGERITSIVLLSNIYVISSYFSFKYNAYQINLNFLHIIYLITHVFVGIYFLSTRFNFIS